MPKSFAGYLAQAKRDWEAGRALDAGRLLYERVPKQQRPGWAARVLELVRDLAPKTPEVERILEIARDPVRWPEAHPAFHAVRRLTLDTKDPLVESVLSLAEKVAKVTYNASGGSAPFEHDAGWRVASDLRVVITRAGEKGSKLKTEAWSILSTMRSAQ